MAAPKNLVEGIALYDYKDAYPAEGKVLYAEDNLSGEIFYKYYKDGSLKEGKTYTEVLDFARAGGKGVGRTNEQINAIKDYLYNIAFHPESVPLDQKARLELIRIRKDGNAIHIDKEQHERKIRALENALNKYKSTWSDRAEAEKEIKDALSMHRGHWLFTLFSAPTSAGVLPSMTEESAPLAVSKK